MEEVWQLLVKTGVAGVRTKSMVDAEVKNDPAIFPTAEVRENLWSSTVYDARTDRLVNRLWTSVKTGQ